jgi:hypothetical protein
MGSTCVVGTAHHHPLGDVAGMFGVPTEHSIEPSGRRSRSLPVRKSFPLPEALGWPSIPHLWGWWGGGQNRDLDPMQQGILRLFYGGDVEDPF